MDVQGACKLRISGLKNEVKHLDQEIKKNTPELKKVRFIFSSVVVQLVILC